jgi:hypothetical protein
MRFRDESDEGRASNFVQISEKVRSKTFQRLDKLTGEENMSRTRVFKWHEKGGTGEEQSQEHVHHFFDIKEIVQKNSSWQAKQSISHTTVTFYCYCVKMCEDLAPKFGDKMTGCCITATHRLTLPFSPWRFLSKIT